jgi:hypothetical protein
MRRETILAAFMLRAKNFSRTRVKRPPHDGFVFPSKLLDTKSDSGVPMPRYLTQHTLACLTRQGAETLARRMQSGGSARAERVLVNMVEGKMFVEFRAETREVLEAWLKTEGMHFDWLVRIEWEMRDDRLQPAA